MAVVNTALTKKKSFFNNQKKTRHQKFCIAALS